MNPNSPHRNQPRAQQRLAQYTIVDEQHGGLVVATFAHPSEWQARSQVIWNMEHTNVPAQIFSMAFNPNGVEAFEFFPMQAFFWLEIDYGTVPIGQNAHGLVRMPPRPAPDALANLVIPNLRRDRQNLQPVPNLWQVFNDPPPQQGESLMARVEYEERGRAIEEEFYGVYSWNQNGGQLNWGFGRLFCFRAERGQLDSMRATFWQIAGSLQPNPQWKQLYDQVVEQLMAGFNVRIGETHARFEREKQIGRQNIAYNDQLINQRNAQVNASIEQTQQEIRERSQNHFTPQDAFGYALRNQTPFHDPNSATGNYRVVEGDYEYNYINNQGEMYSTNDPMDNPSHHQDGTWVEAKPVKPSR